MTKDELQTSVRLWMEKVGQETFTCPTLKAKSASKARALKFNGWANYETWLTYTYCTSVEPLYRMVVQVQSSTALRELVEEFVDLDSQSGFVRDIISTFLDEVNWDEILNALKE